MHPVCPNKLDDNFSTNLALSKFHQLRNFDSKWHSYHLTSNEGRDVFNARMICGNWASVADFDVMLGSRPQKLRWQPLRRVGESPLILDEVLLLLLHESLLLLPHGISKINHALLTGWHFPRIRKSGEKKLSIHERYYLFGDTLGANAS